MSDEKKQIAEESCAGVRFRAAVSGLWYSNKMAAGDIDAVEVDGKLFCEIGAPRDGEDNQ